MIIARVCLGVGVGSPHHGGSLNVPAFRVCVCGRVWLYFVRVCGRVCLYFVRVCGRLCLYLVRACGRVCLCFVRVCGRGGHFDREALLAALSSCRSEWFCALCCVFNAF